MNERLDRFRGAALAGLLASGEHLRLLGSGGEGTIAAGLAAEADAYAHAMMAREEPLAAREPEWIWGRVGLMGNVEILGCYTSPEQGPTFRIRELAVDGTWRERIAGTRALHSVAPDDEAAVRKLVLATHAPEGWRSEPCKAFKDSPVLPGRCACCAHFDAEEHAKHAAKLAREQEVRERLTTLLGNNVVAYGPDGWEDGDEWDGGDDLIVRLRVRDGGRSRDATRQEWQLALDAGLPLGAYPEPREGES